jgi:hypothetical protein
MIEVAIVSMEEALQADGESIPAGSTDLERRPLVLGTTPAGGAAQNVPSGQSAPPVSTVPTEPPPGR